MSDRESAADGWAQSAEEGDGDGEIVRFGPCAVWCPNTISEQSLALTIRHSHTECAVDEQKVFHQKTDTDNL